MELVARGGDGLPPRDGLAWRTSRPVPRVKGREGGRGGAKGAQVLSERIHPNVASTPRRTKSCKDGLTKCVLLLRSGNSQDGSASVRPIQFSASSGIFLSVAKLARKRAWHSTVGHESNESNSATSQTSSAASAASPKFPLWPLA